MMRIHLLTFCTVVLLTSRQLPASPGAEAGDIETEKRSFTTETGAVLDYEIGTLFVPENRSEPNSRLIGVGFARFPAAVQPPPAPPVFRLPGGPGGSFLTRMQGANAKRLENAFPELAYLRPFCDVVFVDQRGFSERGDVLKATLRLHQSPRDEPRTREQSTAAFTEFARQTVADFAEREVDLRGYSVKECAQDVADLREALGYGKITLNGTSFGSQWSFAVMRQHPDIVARALLSGVEPLNHGYDMPSHVFAAVQRMWRTLDDDPRFKPYLPEGGMAEAARVVIQRLEREPLKLQRTLPDAEEKTTIATFGPADFPWNEPTRILELYHGRTEQLNWVAFRRLLAGSQPVRLIGPLIDSSLGVTPDRRYRLWTDPATRYLGRGNFAAYLATADIWPSPDVGDEFRRPVLSDLPVVFAQGDWDTQTPIENTFEIAPFFVNSRVLIAERGGHGVLDPIRRQHPKVWEEFVEFLRTGDMEGIPIRVRLQPSRRFTPPNFPPPSE